MNTRVGARGRLSFTALLLTLSACGEHTETTLTATTAGRDSDATDVASAIGVANVTTESEAAAAPSADPVAPVRVRKTTVTSRLHELFGQDYLQRDTMESLIRAYASGVEPMIPAPDGSLVNYVSFDGDSYQMLQFKGEHTAVLLSPADFEFNGIARVRKAIDELELIYETYQDVMNWEPYGDGLLRVAMLTKTCGWGCGWVGWRGVEMYPDAFSGSEFQGVATHEIGHNFDHVDGLLYNSGDRAHSFTAYWDTFIRHFLGKGGNGLKPEEDLARNVNEWLLPYEDFGGRSWQSCIVDRPCDQPGGNDANGFAVTTEGVVVQRILQFYGAPKLRGWMPQLTNFVSQRGIEESNLTANDRLDLLIESLSLTVNANLTCFFDYWNWPPSSAARARIASLPSSIFCADNDHDGFSPLTRDCLDSNLPTSTCRS